MLPDSSALTPVALWTPTQHTVVLAGVLVAIVLLASVAIVGRDAWLEEVKRHRRLLRRAALGGLVAIGIALLIAHRDELEELLRRIEQGDLIWLLAAAALEALSFGGYMLLTHDVYHPRAERLTWLPSVELTLAGVVATRVLSAGGAGGIAFTGWVLRRAGMGTRGAARRVAAFLVLLYSLYVGALLLGGALVATGLLSAVPRALGLVALAVGGAVTVAMALIVRIPGDLERRAQHLVDRGGALGRLAARLATVPQVAGNAARLAMAIAREHPHVLGWAFIWWAADIATLWACFEAYGEPPAIATLVLCYFLGQMGNLLPLPGGVGGTEGGMVGALAASGVDAGLSLLAVVSYQLISTYLPALPGIASYVSLRRRMKGWPPVGPDQGRVARTAVP
ncbi:MAG TPA: lysylphosphatidylglycerol synthase transmembrane domain-containing protein [Thermoleophilaceae bacterium]